MLAVTNYNQQTPNFRAQVKMRQASTRLGQYLKNKKINPNIALLTSAGAAGAAGSVLMFSQDAVSAPDGAKWAIGGGMTSTLGLMGFLHLKPKLAKAETETAEQTSVASDKVQEIVDAKAESNEKNLFTVEATPVGKIQLSNSGKGFYLNYSNIYAAGKSRLMSYGSDSEYGNRMITEAILKLEILKSLHELSTCFNNVISSKTFGEIKVTDKGIMDYIRAIEQYSAGMGRLKSYGSDSEYGNRMITEAKAKIELIKALGEL